MSIKIPQGFLSVSIFFNTTHSVPNLPHLDFLSLTLFCQIWQYCVNLGYKSKKKMLPLVGIEPGSHSL